MTTTLPLLPVDQAVRIPLDQRVHVADRQGSTPGWFVHDEMYVQDLSKQVLVRVYDDAGHPVGYYGNMTGFVETKVAEASGFDWVQYDLQGVVAAGGRVPAAIKGMTSADYAECQAHVRELSTGATSDRLSTACQDLFRAIGGPVVQNTP